MKFILLKNVKMPTIVAILTFISSIYASSECLKAGKITFLQIFVSISPNIMPSLLEHAFFS